ncbi:MAG: putative zinc-binding metallopeptidase [Candidatus Omnitrophica bacterium]|nr:putative zinc-binding metallopeptidase [Candidatus Omnitrophota bacterium]
MKRKIWFFIVVVIFTLAFCASAKANDIEGIVQRVKEQYGINLVYVSIPVSPSPDVTYVGPGKGDYSILFEYLRVIEKEIQKYPPEFFQKTNLKNIFFVKKLFYQDKAAEGAYNYPHHVIFLDFLRNHGNKIAQRHHFHHEIYHMITQHIPDYTLHHDEVWESWNEPGFAYGKGAGSNQKNPLNLFAPPKLGFMTEYAMMSVEEDKAETYACFFVSSQHKLMHRWMEKDEILRKKVEYMKNFIQNFCSQINEEYWQRFLKLS